MRSVLRLMVFSSSVATFACGAPRALAGGADAPPLVRAELDTDQALAAAIREHYTKYEYRVPMRDGARLFTIAYVPKDATRRYPIMLMRTPYSVQPYGVDNYPAATDSRVLRRFAPSAAFVRHGFVFVHQDVRGRAMSEGTFVDVRPPATTKGGVDESTDAWDTIDWLVKNVPQNNGRVGAWGISYPGFYAAQAAVDAHPALKAVSPQAPVTDWFLGDDFHHNGAFFLADAVDFMASFGKARPEPTPKSTWGFDHDVADVYDYFLALGPVANVDRKHFHGEIGIWNDMVAHPTRDAFWVARDPRPRYRSVKPAVLTVGGWFDAEDCWGALETYRAFEAQSPGAENTLVMGPWRHGGWARTEGDRLGDVTFGQKTSPHYRDRIELPFFRRHLEPDRATREAAAPEAFVFETGTNTWRSYPSWPPPGAKKALLHLRGGGELGEAPPSAGVAGSSFDEYVSDPAKPVPYRGRAGRTIDADYMTDDQRFAARRPDVVVFRSAVLDADVVLSGPLEARLWVSTTGTDADFVVKLVDVYPEGHADPAAGAAGGVVMGGYQQLVRAEVMRGKFRDDFGKPAPFEPGKPTLVRFTLPDVAHAFRAGHRLMVQIQSSWFPLVDRNPQTFVDIFKASESDFRAATHRVYRAPGQASALEVTVVRGALPR